jgi:hypothetical protein
MNTRLPRRGAAVIVAAAVAVAAPASAALPWLSGWPDPAVDRVAAAGPGAVAYSLANGFPLWFEDANGVRLALCLDQTAVVGPGDVIFPCATGEPFPGAPISFPSNFGAEAAWWSATAASTFTSRLGEHSLSWFALLVLAQEARFAGGFTADGEQVAVGRIRLRATLPVPGTYVVTHPYGQATYVVPPPPTNPALAPERALRQEQQVGNLLAPGPGQAYREALSDGPPPPAPGFDPAIDVGAVSSDATGIGPFLTPLTPAIAAQGGALYLADPGTDLAPSTVPVTGSPHGTNHLRIELLDPPDGFVLDAATGNQWVQIDRFQVTGKYFDAGENAAPIAEDDVASAAKGREVVVDVLANDRDLPGPGNAHGIDPGAIALPAPGGGYLLTATGETQRGGRVRRVTDFASGRAAFAYTPPPGFTGEDAFGYVVQDRGGRVSGEAVVRITVEELTVAEAEYRPRVGKWRVAGTTSDASDNVIAIRGTPCARLVAPGGARAGVACLQPGADGVRFDVELNPPPGSRVTQAHLHVGAPGEEGPILAWLVDAPGDGELRARWSGALRAGDFQPSPAHGIFSLADVVEAVLDGRTSVDVHTVARPEGEAAGTVSAPLVGSAPVDPETGRWSFRGRSRYGPGGAPPNVTATSANGIRAPGAPLRVR